MGVIVFFKGTGKVVLGAIQEDFQKMGKGVSQVAGNNAETLMPPIISEELGGIISKGATSVVDVENDEL